MFRRGGTSQGLLPNILEVLQGGSIMTEPPGGSWPNLMEVREVREVRPRWFDHVVEPPRGRGRTTRRPMAKPYQGLAKVV